MLSGATRAFFEIDGSNWAGAFAFNAFFSLFPLILLAVTVASFFVDRQSAGRAVVDYVQASLPLTDEMKLRIFGTIAGVIEARKRTGLLAFLLLIWTALQCFTTLVLVTNRAWGVRARHWWRLPLGGIAGLAVTAGALLVGLAAPAVAGVGKTGLLQVFDRGAWVYTVFGFVVPVVVLFVSLALFYRLAPYRKTRFSEVWVAAACATALLRGTESLFVIYLERFATLNAVYGVFGGIMALLLFIYLSGCGFIFGACLCAAQAEERSGHDASPGTKGRAKAAARTATLASNEPQRAPSRAPDGVVRRC